MPKDSDIIGIIFLLFILSKKNSLFQDLHRITELLNKVDRVSSTVNSLPDLNQMAQKIGPLMSMLSTNSLPSYDDYSDENRNAIF